MLKKYAYEIIMKKIVIPVLRPLSVLLLYIPLGRSIEVKEKRKEIIRNIAFGVPYCGKDILMIKEIRSNVCLIGC